MKTALALLFLCALTAIDAPAQGKGVDQQNDRIRACVAAYPAEFRRYGSARRLYHFDIDNAGDY